MATITSTAPIEVHPRETAITLCLEIARECFKFQNVKPTIDPNDVAYNAWWIVRRTAEILREASSIRLSSKQARELDEAVFTFHGLACPNHAVHYDVCRCEAANLIHCLLSVLERS